jgi:thioredoxin 1
MFSRRILLQAAASAAMLASAALAGTTALAAEEEPFTREAFLAAQSSGKSILVEIHASWCPTCQAQKPILGKLFADPKFKNLAVFRVDFDSQKDEVRNFKARIQSTLITFKGKEEIARSVGDTNPDSIADLLALSL